MILAASKAIIFVFIITACLYSQSSLEDQYKFAESLYNKEQYFDAITELKRLSFFDNQHLFSYRSDFMIAGCYKQGGKFEDAIRYFSLCLKYARVPDEQFRAKIGIIRCNILRRTTAQSLLLLNELEKDFPLKKEDIIYWRGWTYIFSGDWDRAGHEFGQIEKGLELSKLCEQTSEQETSVTFAKVISYIIPGSGQIYTGNVLSGLMSLGWNALFVYLAIDAFNADRILDGFVYTGLFFRFHRGNIENAEKFALNNNVEISNKTLNILEDYRGERP